MDIVNIRNKILVIGGHARHLAQASGELTEILAAHPEIDLAEIAPDLADRLTETDALRVNAGEAIGAAVAAFGGKITPGKKAKR